MQGEAYRGLDGISSASASDVAGSVCPDASADDTPLALSAGKLALKFLYSSSLGFCDVLLLLMLAKALMMFEFRRADRCGSEAEAGGG